MAQLRSRSARQPTRLGPGERIAGMLLKVDGQRFVVNERAGESGVYDLWLESAGGERVGLSIARNTRAAISEDELREAARRYLAGHGQEDVA